MKVKGKALFSAFAGACIKAGMTQEEGAKQIGISASYIRALDQGSRDIEAIPFRVLVNFANFIGVNVSQVLLLADLMSAEDFIVADTVEDRFVEFIRHVKVDPEFGALLKESDAALKMLDNNNKIFLMLMYEKAFRVCLLEQASPVQRVNEGS